jgi:hypothetical protein
VVEDEDTLRPAVSKMLRKNGISVIEVIDVKVILTTAYCQETALAAFGPAWPLSGSLINSKTL